MERDAQVACARAQGIDYNRLSISSFTGAAAENSDEEDEHARLVNKSRFSSADVYMLGPINSDKTYAIAKERSDAREAARIAKEQRANARANKKSSKEVEMVSAYNEFKHDLTSQSAFKLLNKFQLMSYLHCTDGANHLKHNKLANKSDLLEYVLSLNVDLPANDASHRSGLSASTGGKRTRCEPRDENGSSEETSGTESDEGESDDSAASVYKVDHFVSACKHGRSYFLKVRWEGYDESGDTWEKVSELRKYQSTMV